MTRLLLWPGELVVTRSRIEGEDHQAMVRMLVNGLVWLLILLVGPIAFLT